MTWLTGARILLPDGKWHEGAVDIEESRIAAIAGENGAGSGYTEIELGGGYLIPGLFDIQVNGGGGVLFNDAPSVATLRKMAASCSSRRLSESAALRCASTCIECVYAYGRAAGLSNALPLRNVLGMPRKRIDVFRTQ